MMKTNQSVILLILLIGLSGCGSTGMDRTSSFMNAVGTGLGAVLGGISKAGDQMTNTPNYNHSTIIVPPRTHTQTHCYKRFGDIVCDTY